VEVVIPEVEFMLRYVAVVCIIFVSSLEEVKLRGGEGMAAVVLLAPRGR